MSLADQQWCPTSVQVTVLQARGLRIKGKSGTNDAYAVMQVGKEKYQTSVVEKSVAPVWREEAAFDLPPLQQGGGGGGGGTERSTLHVQVLHRALVGPDKLLGQAVINLLQLSDDKTRNKTEWFKLLDKTSKADKDRGEVLVDIQFLRNNMTASMFDLSAAGKSKSRLGKFKDKVRGKKKDTDAASTVVPSFSQVLTDSEEEGNGDDEVTAGKDEKKKKLKMKSLFSPKSNLQRNMSQSMSVLPAKNSSLSGSQSSGLNVDSSEGKKKFKFMIHKRSDSKESSSGHQKHGAAEQSNLCINGSHVYCEEPQSRTSRIGSNFSLTSSGHGSMEDVPESSPPSVDSLRAVRQYSPWMEDEEETTKVENIEEDVGELRREEEERIEEERVRRQEELEKLTEEKKRQEEEKRRAEEETVKREEEERIRREEEEEKIRREEEERAQAERRKQEEEERVRREEEERERLAEENRRLEEQERRRIEEEERLRMEEEAKMRQKEEHKLAEEKRRLEEERIRIEEEKIRKGEEERAQEEKRRQEEEEMVRRQEKELEEKRRLEEERRIEEEKVRKEENEREQEERRRKEENEREQEERRRQEEEEMMRRQEKELEEKRRLEEERIRIEEEKIRKGEEKRRQEEEEMVRRQEKELEEMRRLEEQERQWKEEEIIKEKERRQEEEEKARRENDEFEGLVEETKKTEEEERKKIEEEEKIKREEEERIRVEEEERVRRREEELEKLAEQKRILEEQEIRRIEEEEKRQRAERIRKEEKMRKEEEERVRRQEKEEVERLAEEKRRREEEERRRTDEEKVIREEDERIRKEEDERAQEEKRQEERVRKENEEMERLAEEKRRLEEQEMKSTEEEERVRMEEKAEKESKEEQAMKLEKEKLTEDADEQKRRENDIKHKAAETKSKVVVESPADVTSTNPFDENLNNSFEEIHSSPAGPDSSTAKVSTVRQRCQSVGSSVGSKTVCTDEKDLISPQRERRPAPQPPRRNQAERQSQKEQDRSTPHLAQINKHSKDKDVKTISVLPQRSVQIIAPLSRSPTETKNTQSLPQSSTTKGTTNVAKHSKRPAPSRPHSVEGRQSSEPKTALSSDGKISSECGSEAKQQKTVYGLNPFEDDEDENEFTAQDDRKTGSIQWPPAVSQGANEGATSKTKIKSSKVAHAPPLPTTKAGTSTTLISQNTEGGHVIDETGVMIPDNRVTHACVSESVSPLHAQEFPSAGEEANGKKEGPTTGSRRLQPVKPLNSLEQQSVSVVGGGKDNKSTGSLCGDQKNTKVNDTGLKGPYSQLTQEELISLVLKQKKQLSERDKKISELEQYIDNLLVRVIEEQPSILMSMNSLKKSV